jgi:hypothetical protein
MSPEFIDKVRLKRTPDSIKAAGIPSLARERARALAAKTIGKFILKVYNANELFAVPQAYEGLGTRMMMHEF